MVTALALVVAIFGMWRMDFLSSPRSHYVRMTDSARNAYVAKNLVDGKGYVTNDIPAALIGFYSQRGKLSQDAWPNADRFPFTTFAIAALYTITQRVDYDIGITLYNILCFTILITLLYRLSLAVFQNHYSALLTVTVALMHHGTYLLLYQKDADSVALTVGVLIGLIRWIDTPRDKQIRRTPLLGTLLAWLFLARPNVGLPILLYLAIEIVRWARDNTGEPSGREKAKLMLRTYGALAAVFAVWTLPYAIYSWKTWGSPFFSANSLYQLPLGTRLSLGGDTWWKYYGPERVLTFMSVAREVPHEILWKVVSSWILTFRLCLSSYITEVIILVLARLTIWNNHSKDRDPAPRASTRTVGRLLLAVVLFNFLILPIFGWAYFPWKQYLFFAMPWVWVFVGQALYRFFTIASARFSRELPAQFFWSMLTLSIAVVVVGQDGGGGDGTFLTPGLTHWVWSSWIVIAVLLGVVLILRPRTMTPLRSVILSGAAILLAYSPSVDLKSDSINYFPIGDGVARTLKERTGLVSSLALQSEVSWLSDRRHIPVPENALLLYKYHSDFGLEVEDVYLESAETMVTPPFGPFTKFMPGLESYARLERYQAPLPGYEIVFHQVGSLGYSKYKVSTRPKASTIYRLTDPKARDAVQSSPDLISLGDVKQGIHLTHGFAGYYQIEGRHVVALTNITRRRYRGKPPMPWEDASVSFYLSDRTPKQITLSLYAPQDTKLDLYWNLDLDAYDVSGQRSKRKLASLDVKRGWQTFAVDVPANLPRRGLNKLGLRATEFVSADGCLDGTELCAAITRDSAKRASGDAAPRFASIYEFDTGAFQVAEFLESLAFTY